MNRVITELTWHVRIADDPLHLIVADPQGADLPPRRVPHGLTPGQLKRLARDARIVAASRAGLDRRRIARKFALSESTVADVVRTFHTRMEPEPEPESP